MFWVTLQGTIFTANHHPRCWLFCTLHHLLLSVCCLFHSSNPDSSQRILKKPFHHWDHFTSNPLSSHVPHTTHDPPLRIPLTLPADWELQSPLPNLYCYRALPLAAQIERRLLLVEQNCSGSSHWSKSRVAVMQEQYFNKLLEQRDGDEVA